MDDAGGSSEQDGAVDHAARLPFGTHGGGEEPPHSWIAIPVGRADDGPTIAQFVEAVRAAGGMVGGQALFDPRYEAEMRRFLIRALEMEGIPLPEGGDRP